MGMSLWRLDPADQPRDVGVVGFPEVIHKLLRIGVLYMSHETELKGLLESIKRDVNIRMESHLITMGYDFHFMDKVPDNLKDYETSYILTKDKQLYFIDSKGLSNPIDTKPDRFFKRLLYNTNDFLDKEDPLRLNFGEVAKNMGENECFEKLQSIFKSKDNLLYLNESRLKSAAITKPHEESLLQKNMITEYLKQIDEHLKSYPGKQLPEAIEKEMNTLDFTLKNNDRTITSNSYIQCPLTQLLQVRMSLHNFLQSGAVTLPFSVGTEWTGLHLDPSIKLNEFNAQGDVAYMHETARNTTWQNLKEKMIQGITHKIGQSKTNQSTDYFAFRLSTGVVSEPYILKIHKGKIEAVICSQECTFNSDVHKELKEFIHKENSGCVYYNSLPLKHDGDCTRYSDYALLHFKHLSETLGNGADGAFDMLQKKASYAEDDEAKQKKVFLNYELYSRCGYDSIKKELRPLPVAVKSFISAQDPQNPQPSDTSKSSQDTTPPKKKVEVQAEQTNAAVVINEYKACFASNTWYQKPENHPTEVKKDSVRLKFESSKDLNVFAIRLALEKTPPLPFTLTDKITQRVMAYSTGDGQLYHGNGCKYKHGDAITPCGDAITPCGDVKDKFKRPPMQSAQSSEDTSKKEAAATAESSQKFKQNLALYKNASLSQPAQQQAVSSDQDQATSPHLTPRPG